MEQLAEDGFPIQYRKAHLRCPLLDEKNRCLIYEHRPIACRGHYLLEGDASFCARDEDRGKILSSTPFLIETGVVEYMNLLFQDRFSQLVLDGRTLP
jgi:Fe-S-cluster containining protein